MLNDLDYKSKMYLLLLKKGYTVFTFDNACMHFILYYKTKNEEEKNKRKTLKFPWLATFSFWCLPI